MEWCVTQHSLEKQKQWGHTHTHLKIFYKELAHTNTDAANLESQWGCFLSKSQDLRSREARGRSPHPRAREDPRPTSSCQADREHEFCLPPSCVVFMALVDQMMSTHIREGWLLHSAHQFKRSSYPRAPSRRRIKK